MFDLYQPSRTNTQTPNNPRVPMTSHNCSCLSWIHGVFQRAAEILQNQKKGVDAIAGSLRVNIVVESGMGLEMMSLWQFYDN